MKKSLMFLLCTLFMWHTSLSVTVPTVGCVGGTYDFSELNMTGCHFCFWSSSDTNIATVDSFSGIVTAVSPGVVTIMYHPEVVIYLLPFTVHNALPTATTGNDTVCLGASILLSNPTVAGVWTSSDTLVASVNPYSGIVTTNAAGRTDIVYMTSGGSCASHPLMVSGFNSDSTLLGSSQVCIGLDIALTPGNYYDSFGVWSSSNPSVASATQYTVVPFANARVVGLAAGTTIISYTRTYPATSGGCVTTFVRYKQVTVEAPSLAASIVGPSTVCLGASITLGNATPGGYWSSASPAVVSIPVYGATPGSSVMAAGISVGNAIITYMVSAACGGSYVTSTAVDTITVLPLDTVGAIVGLGSVCPGASIVLTNSTAGGVWTSADTSVGAIGSTGIVTAVSSGTTIISYIISGLCNVAVATDTVNVLPLVNAGTITGSSTLCTAAITTLTDSVTGGIWSTGSPAVATIDAAGNLYGSSAGTASVTYTVSGLCNTASTSAAITVLPVVAAGTISGASTVVAGSSAGMVSSVSGGTWTASPLSVATIDPVIGILSAVSAGTATVSYTVTGCGGPVSDTYSVAVTAYDGISGQVNFGAGGAYMANIKVWLITYAAPMLSAVDSFTAYCTGTSIYYHFDNVPAGSYRVKAASTDLPTGPYDYMPTYLTNSFYWDTALVVTHVSGTHDIGQDINMNYGVSSSGPGFIGGDVTTGANKGTATGIPAVGLNMYLFTSASPTPLQMAVTDATGHYTFSNLPVGVTYFVFPEALNYTTTPYTGIVLTSAAPSRSGANFVQHTLSHTITPIPAGISILTTAAAAVMAFPNPTTGKVSLTWQLPSAEDAAVTVSDITGREVYTTAVSMAAGAGISQLNLSSLNNGLYTISVKSADLNYNSKLQVQH